MGMGIYSALLAVGLAVSAPWWLWRMARQGRYREGLGQRLGRVPSGLRAAVAGKQVVWIHAVSVGEVLAAGRLVTELGERLGASWVVVVSTTTATGQALARERFGAERGFFLPLDFGFAVRAFLRVLRPKLLVLMESELWPRLLAECTRAGVPVAVANARMSDRSFRRALRVRRVWGWMGGKVSVWLAQGEETAGRLRALGVDAGRVQVLGNLKYDAAGGVEGPVVDRVRRLVAERTVVVAGSTLTGEETLLLDAWDRVRAEVPAVFVLAPRHPQRFREVESLLREHGLHVAVASSDEFERGDLEDGAVILLDTVGDLASIYGLAAVAFVGGSLVAKGGHNPLEAARFGVPVVMGESYENFREIVEGMRAAEALRIVKPAELAEALVELLRDGREMGGRGRAFYEAQVGATGRTVAALLELVR